VEIARSDQVFKLGAFNPQAVEFDLPVFASSYA
jgi:hypothetical protein